ncbi:hypothetical protein DMENIID0001_164460 [Sergentomyia squamirostris]
MSPRMEALIQRIISHESLEISRESVTMVEWCEHILQLYVDYIGICRNLTVLFNSQRSPEMDILMQQLLRLTVKCLLRHHVQLQNAEIADQDSVVNTMISFKLTPCDLELHMPGATRCHPVTSRDILVNTNSTPTIQRNSITRLNSSIKEAQETTSAESLFEMKNDLAEINSAEMAEELSSDATLESIRNALYKYATKLISSHQHELPQESLLKLHHSHHDTAQDTPGAIVCQKNVRKSEKVSRQKDGNNGRNKKKKSQKKKSTKGKSQIYDDLKVLLEKCRSLCEADSESPGGLQMVSPANQLHLPRRIQSDETPSVELVQQMHRAGVISYSPERCLSDFISERYVGSVLVKNKLRLLQFALCNWVDFLQIAPVCIVGEAGVGKKFLVQCFAAEIDAVTIDIGAAWRWERDVNVNDFAEKVIKLAEYLQPAILLLDNVHMHCGTKKKAETEMKSLLGVLTKRVSQAIDTGDKILFIGVSNEPWRGNLRTMKTSFHDFMYLPATRYTSVQRVWMKSVRHCDDIPWVTTAIVSPLAWATRDLSIASVTGAVEQTLSVKRSLCTSPSQFVLHLTQTIKNLIDSDNVGYLPGMVDRKKMTSWLFKALKGRIKKKRKILQKKSMKQN